ncbi:MAG TPA: class I SAM-dependent methyltransferase [Chloroflexia bacterium]|nr:class I SAM-dependent methyltransferase [Chloroflexia bacterium]
MAGASQAPEKLYDEKYFAAQISKSDAKAAIQYGKLLRFGGVTAATHPRLLDAGCGAGPALPFLQKQGFRLIGSDFIFYPLLEAQKRAPEVPLLNFDLAQGLPFTDSSFEVILASEVIEHLRDPLYFLQEARRVLASGGVLLLTTPNLWDVRRLGAAITRTTWSGHRDPTHINLMNPRSLSRLMKEAGFERTRWKTGIKPAYSRSIRRLGWGLELPYPPVIGNGLMAAAFKD